MLIMITLNIFSTPQLKGERGAVPICKNLAPLKIIIIVTYFIIFGIFLLHHCMIPSCDPNPKIIIFSLK